MMADELPKWKQPHYKRNKLYSYNGEIYTYGAVHQWIRKKYGKATYCALGEHKAKIYEWSNISGEYQRNINDWRQLCPSCHRKEDFTEEQRIKMRNAKIGSTPINRVTVRKLSSDGVFIAEFPSITEAATAHDITRSAISNNLSGLSRTCAGFIWRYI